MKSRLIFTLMLLIGLLLTFTGNVSADGIIIPTPQPCRDPDCNIVPPLPHSIQQLAIRYHHVTVTINEQVVITHVDQVFYNPNDWTIEGTYYFPLPEGAAVTGFTLWIDGQPVKGEVLSADQARQTYEEIVNSMRDPALLEYADRGAVRAQIYPIPPQGERRIELEYTQALTAENGLVHYVYPLNTEKFSTEPLESVSITVDVRSTQPIKAAYSPTHSLAISRETDFHVTGGYEASQVIPDTDFSFYYSLGKSEAFHLLTYCDPTDPLDPDGFFLLLLAPQPGDAGTQQVAKDVLLVLDHSGSMDGEKFRQAQQALIYILEHLNPEDRFGITTFSTGVESYPDGLHPTSDVPDAVTWVNRLSAAGSTDINRALLEAASSADAERPTYLIFLTDGLPTVGEMNTQRILGNFSSAARANLRLFAFGVGYDVDTILLDSLAQDHQGASSYVRPGEALDEILSGFYAKISTPLLTDLKLDFGKITAYDIYPNPLPDLFRGSQIVVVGRYHDGGTANVTLSGLVNNEPQTFRYDEQTFTRDNRGESASLAAIPRLWATRKIGTLLNQVRLQGADQETIDQIVKLSIRYGIVTPYTSYLVTEPQALGAANQERIAQDQFNQIMNTPSPSSSGQAAVEKAAGQEALSEAEAPAASPVDAANQIRIVGSRTFVLTDGIWTDTTFDPVEQKTTPVAFLSPDYFALAKAHPDLAAALALGEQVIVIFDGTAYQIVSSDTSTAPVKIPTQMMPTESPVATLPVGIPTAQPTSSSGGSTTTPTSKSAPICAGVLIPLAVIACIKLLRR